MTSRWTIGGVLAVVLAVMVLMAGPVYMFYLELQSYVNVRLGRAGYPFRPGRWR